MRLPYQTPVALQSNLIKEDVLLRLREAVVSRYAMFKSRSRYPVAGVVKRESCSLLVRTFYHNGFQRVLKLRIEDRGSVTWLVGQFTLQLPTLIFGGIWFGCSALFTLSWTWQFFRHGLQVFTVSPTGRRETSPDGRFLLFPWGMMLAGWLLLDLVFG